MVKELNKTRFKMLKKFRGYIITVFEKAIYKRILDQFLHLLFYANYTNIQEIYPSIIECVIYFVLCLKKLRIDQHDVSSKVEVLIVHLYMI